MAICMPVLDTYIDGHSDDLFVNYQHITVY